MDKIIDKLYKSGAPGKIVLGNFIKLNNYDRENIFVTDILPDNIEAVLNLRAEHSDIFAANKLKAYIWMPIKDESPYPGNDWLNTAVNFIETCIYNDWNTLVHCAAGISRSSMVVIAYLMRLKEMSFQKAFDFVEEKCICKPNPYFILGLKDYECWIRSITG